MKAGIKKGLALFIAFAVLGYAAPSRAAEAPLADVPHADSPLGETSGADSLRVDSSGMMLMDGETTRVLASANAHLRLPMASTTKIMTALLAIENCALDEVVTVTSEAYGTEGSTMHLKLGEEIVMWDLLHGLMLRSGNDAAVAIAVHVGGSVSGFAKMMNERAAELGCSNTQFVTPHGLHNDAHYTTAFDLALIACAAMRNDTFKELVGTKYWRCESGAVARTLKNTNKMLWQYEDGNGIKTGYTKAAGRCLVFSAERGGNTLIGVVLNATDTWADATSLLDYGYKEHTWKSFAKAGEVQARIEVRQGTPSDLALVAKEDILIPVGKDEDASRVQLKLIHPSRMEAPVSAGQEVGMIEVWCDGRVIKRVPLLAGEAVTRNGVSYYIWELIKELA